MLPSRPPLTAAPQCSPRVLVALLVDVQQEGQCCDGKEHPEEHGQHIPCKPSTGTLHWAGPQWLLVKRDGAGLMLKGRGDTKAAASAEHAYLLEMKSWSVLLQRRQRQEDDSLLHGY